MKTVYKNAKIYTMNEKQPWAEELIVEDGKITYVGKTHLEEIRETVVVDCHGKMMMPSFVDSHCHPGWVSKSMWHIKLPLIDNVEELLDYVKNFAECHPKEEVPFLYFDYYETELFDEDGPKKEMLDQAVSDRPCIMVDFTEHASWLNTKALELMGVDKNTPDPDKLHVFWRDREGNPTGWVKEFAYMPYLDNVYKEIGWYPPDALSISGMMPYFLQMKKWGYTGIFVGFLEEEAEIRTAYELNKSGELNLFYDAAVRCDTLAELGEKIDLLKKYEEKYSNEYIRLKTIKLFLDGSMASGNAGLLQALENDPERKNCGVTALNYDELKEYIGICNKEDVDVHIHIVGDRSFRMVCDAVEELKREDDNKWNIQVVIAHACLVNKADRKRPAELGISVNITPHWNAGMYGESGIPVLGKERWMQQGSFIEIIESGAQVAFSTDTTSMFEFNRSNPFVGIQCGYTKVDMEYPLDSEKYPGSVMPPIEEKIPIEYALKGFTVEGAKQLGISHITGTLEVGKRADFVILSDNCFEVDPFDIKDIRVEKTVFGGKVIYNEANI